MTTKRETIEDRKRGILIRELPRTFRDAVSIARRLQIQYVWIDSLCIIQDNKFDWEREASKMADIYANAYLTIAASFSSDSSSGCLPSWSIRAASPHVSSETVSLNMPAIDSSVVPILDTRGQPITPLLFVRQPLALVDTAHNNLASKVYVHFEWLPSSKSYQPNCSVIGADAALGLRYDPIASEPLSTRGWTLQERLFSPRILHCGTEQLFWECRVNFLSEEGSRFFNTFFDIDTIIQRQLLPLSERGIHSIPGDTLTEGEPPFMTMPSGRWNGGWLEVVEAYSRRKLTYWKDKLPALAALARLIAEKTQDEYYAGLWRDHIFEDLHWGVVSRDSSPMPPFSEARRYYSDRIPNEPRVSEVYRAPSWSWVSLDASIKFIPLDLKRAVAELIICHTDLAGSDPYSEVIGGFIKLWVSNYVRNQLKYLPLTTAPLGTPFSCLQSYFNVERQRHAATRNDQVRVALCKFRPCGAPPRPRRLSWQGLFRRRESAIPLLCSIS
jgi:hypothetical protein